jgi:Zn-dependent protease with chaperone function
MIAALALFAGMFAVGWLVPGVLSRMDMRRRDPLLLIVVWLTSSASVLLAAATGVLLLLLPDHGASALVLSAVHECWSAILHGSPPQAEEVAGLVGVGLLCAFAVRLMVVCVSGFRRRYRRREENLGLLRLVARPTTDPSDVLWLVHDEPMAFSMAGRPGVVVATDGLTRHLDPGAVAAVLAHERAHLKGRHHLLVAISDAVRKTFPFVPLFQLAPDAIRRLVELAADVKAARSCGSAAVHAALLRVARHVAPDTALAMAQDAVDLRLARLQHGSELPGRLRRTVSCGLAVVTAAMLPFVVGVSILLGIAVVACPLIG